MNDFAWETKDNAHDVDLDPKDSQRLCYRQEQEESWLVTSCQSQQPGIEARGAKFRHGEAAEFATHGRLHEPPVLTDGSISVDTLTPTEPPVTDPSMYVECSRDEGFGSGSSASNSCEPSLPGFDAAVGAVMSTKFSMPESNASFTCANGKEHEMHGIETAYVTSSPLWASTSPGGGCVADGPVNSAPSSLCSEDSEKKHTPEEGHACLESSALASPLSLDTPVDADGCDTSRHEQRGNNLSEEPADEVDWCAEPFEYAMLDYIGKCPRVHAQLSGSMRHTKSLLHSLRVQKERCLRQNSSTPRRRPLRSSPDVLPGRTIGRSVPCDVNPKPEADDLPSVAIAIECATLIRAEVASLTALHQKLHHIWNLSGKRLAVSQRRAEQIKQQRLKRALIDVLRQTETVDTLIPIHDGAVKEAIEAVGKRIARAPHAGWCSKREKCIRNIENQIERTCASLSLLSSPIVCNAQVSRK